MSKVLTVDDSRTIRLLVRKHLQPLGLEILEAADGREGVEVARKELPDLIILDVNMPVMDGKQALEQIRKDPTTSRIPVLMLTAESAKALVVELIQIGISDYIVKPFQENVLIKRVEKLLNLNQSKKESASGGGADGLKTVLILDDNESVLIAARKFLTGVAEVVATTKPEKALQLAGQVSPTLVLLDAEIPGTNVNQILETLQDDSSLRSCRFVALATQSKAEEMGNGGSGAFADILIKPFDQEALVRLVSG